MLKKVLLLVLLVLLVFFCFCQTAFAEVLPGRFFFLKDVKISGKVQTAVHMLDPNTGKIATVKTDLIYGRFCFLSPDGERLLYPSAQSGKAVTRIVNIRTGKNTLVDLGQESTPLGWSADGKKVFVKHGGNDGESVFEVSVPGNNRRKIFSPTEGSVGDKCIGGGNKTFYDYVNTLRDNSEGEVGVNEIWTMDSNAKKKKFADGALPDVFGSKIAYEDNHGGIVVKDFVSNKKSVIKNGLSPVFSPEGKYLAYSKPSSDYASVIFVIVRASIDRKR